MKRLDKSEQETHINKLAIEDDWTIYTDDSKMVTFFKKICKNWEKVGDFGYTFILKPEQIEFKKIQKRAKIKI